MRAQRIGRFPTVESEISFKNNNHDQIQYMFVYLETQEFVIIDQVPLGTGPLSAPAKKIVLSEVP